LAHVLAGYAFTLAYGFVTSKLVLGKNASTLPAGLATLIYIASI